MLWRAQFSRDALASCVSTATLLLASDLRRRPHDPLPGHVKYPEPSPMSNAPLRLHVLPGLWPVCRALPPSEPAPEAGTYCCTLPATGSSSQVQKQLGLFHSAPCASPGRWR
ncbi:hypothetical protein NDU88_010264 [Pleurodeles waltl]|uniref:Secreted protein n=1 Tax=Pleurodeles waltl TaxID=8319 RepID=A0AAV7RYR8_PLEWA|nr:hypothetical protein NDU88_010264 [Pleurodeles waltl]